MRSVEYWNNEGVRGTLPTMTMPTDNETWLVDAGDTVIEKKAKVGMVGLSTWEKLVYYLWVADYGMRNAGDLSAAKDVYATFQAEGRQAAGDLSLGLTHEALAMPEADLEREYFGHFEAICDELRAAEPRSQKPWWKLW